MKMNAAAGAEMKEKGKKAVNFILDVLFPPCCPACGRSIRKEEGFCPECMREVFIPFPGKLCPRCGKNPCICSELSPPYQRTWAAAFYEGAVQRAVRRFKFHNHPGSAELLGGMMAETFLSSGAEAKEFDLLVPIPSRARKKRQRGYNQAVLLAKEISKRTKIPMNEKVLIKIRDTKAQHNLNEQDRLKNLKGSFSAGKEVCGQKILLIDDVLTTGSTAKEAATALFAAGAEEVSVLVLAVTRLKDEP